MVTPFVGVWIEILNFLLTSVHTHWSLPSWECGLKFINGIKYDFMPTVTPFVGVWIEIFDIIER